MTQQTPPSKQKIVIVGGGFAGVRTAIELSRQDHLDVTIVSDRPDFYYYPTLYHTATGGSSEESNIPLEAIFADDPVTIVINKAVSIDRENKLLTLEKGKPLSYDRLILALGVVTNYFGIPGLAENSFGIKSLEEAERFKRHLHAQLIAEHQPDLNYIIVGGGPTGIELAGDLGVYLHEIMKHHGIKDRTVHIDLVEAQPHLMPRLPKKVARRIERRLRKLGVTLYLNKKVEGATMDELHVSGKPIRSHTIVWTAGVANNPFFDTTGFALSGRHKVLVDEFLRAEGSKDIFVLGDNAETPYSGMAQTAVYDAEFIAHNFRLEHEDRPKLAYHAKEPIYVTPVGRNWASVLWGKTHIDGILGWWLRGAADLKAFTELLPVAEATVQWTSALDHEDLCPVCSSVRD